MNSTNFPLHLLGCTDCFSNWCYVPFVSLSHVQHESAGFLSIIFYPLVRNRVTRIQLAMDSQPGRKWFQSKHPGLSGPISDPTGSRSHPMPVCTVSQDAFSMTLPFFPITSLLYPSIHIVIRSDPAPIQKV